MPTERDTPTEARVRLPAFAWHLERLYGPKVAQCLNCGSLDIWENHARASYNCRDCGSELTAEHGVRLVPADPSARNPDEEHLPQGRWASDFPRVRRFGGREQPSCPEGDPYCDGVIVTPPADVEYWPYPCPARGEE